MASNKATTVAAMALATGLTFGSLGTATAQAIMPLQPAAPEVITVNGTVLRIVDAQSLQAARDEIRGQLGPLDEMQPVEPGAGQYAAFLTSDITGQPTLVWLDLSWLHDHNIEGYANLEENESVQVRLQTQPGGGFLAREYAELAKGSMVNNTDWGVQEEYTTRDDSINARTKNGPDDDEARAQYERRLEEQEEDD